MLTKDEIKYILLEMEWTTVYENKEHRDHHHRLQKRMKGYLGDQAAAKYRALQVKLSMMLEVAMALEKLEDI